MSKSCETGRGVSMAESARARCRQLQIQFGDTVKQQLLSALQGRQRDGTGLISIQEPSLLLLQLGQLAGHQLGVRWRLGFQLIDAGLGDHVGVL